MSRLDQYILELEKLCGQEIPGAQGNISSFFRAIWLEIVVIFRFVCATIGPFLLAYIPVGIAIGIYHIWKCITKVDEPCKIYRTLYEYYDWDYTDRKRLFLESKWKNMPNKDKEFLTLHQIPLDVSEELFFKLLKEWDAKSSIHYNLKNRAKWIILIPTLLFYILAAYPYYLIVGFTVMTIVIVTAVIFFMIFMDRF